MTTEAPWWFLNVDESVRVGFWDVACTVGLWGGTIITPAAFLYLAWLNAHYRVRYPEEWEWLLGNDWRFWAAVWAALLSPLWPAMAVGASVYGIWRVTVHGFAHLARRQLRAAERREAAERAAREFPHPAIELLESQLRELPDCPDSGPESRPHRGGTGAAARVGAREGGDLSGDV